MVLTTFLLSIALREIWGLPLPAVIAIGVGFATVEAAFLSANMLKFADGGWVPVLLAIAALRADADLANGQRRGADTGG